MISRNQVEKGGGGRKWRCKEEVRLIMLHLQKTCKIGQQNIGLLINDNMF